MEEKYNQILEDLAEYLETCDDKEDALVQLVCDLDDMGVIDCKWVEMCVL
jgi:hypothetical protein